MVTIFATLAWFAGSSWVMGCSASTPAPSAAKSPTTAGTAGDAPLLSEGRLWTARFYSGETAALWERFNPRLQKFMKSKSDLDGFRSEVQSQLGPESRVIEEHIDRDGDVPIYVRTSVFTKVPDKVAVRIGFDAAGRIAGFGVRPSEKPQEAPSSFLEYVTKTPLRLPFNGEWFVVWGGRTLADNAHAVSPAQRFAYDFEVVRNGSSHRGDGKSNTDYACYGEPIVAPAAGKVVIAVDGVADNVPGVMNRDAIPGNHVVIDHGQNEFSFLAHLQKGSVRVNVGDAVTAGAPLGSCGNSGNSSQPHLHYHLQNSSTFPKSEGLPAQFRDYTADGKHVDSGEPLQKQRIVNGRP